MWQSRQTYVAKHTFLPPVGRAKEPSRAWGSLARPIRPPGWGASGVPSAAPKRRPRPGQSAPPVADRSAQRLQPHRRWAAPVTGSAARQHGHEGSAPSSTGQVTALPAARSALRRVRKRLSALSHGLWRLGGRCGARGARCRWRRAVQQCHCARVDLYGGDAIGLQGHATRRAHTSLHRHRHASPNPQGLSCRCAPWRNTVLFFPPAVMPHRRSS
jgi:hypothetical protein